MTLLISLVEASPSIQFPYPYQMVTDLYSGHLVHDTLVFLGVPHTLEYAAQEGEAKLMIDAEFHDAEQMVGYLELEERLVWAQYITTRSATFEQNLLHASYMTVRTNLISNTLTSEPTMHVVI